MGHKPVSTHPISTNTLPTLPSPAYRRQHLAGPSRWCTHLAWRQHGWTWRFHDYISGLFAQAHCNSRYYHQRRGWGKTRQAGLAKDCGHRGRTTAGPACFAGPPGGYRRVPHLVSASALSTMGPIHRRTHPLTAGNNPNKLSSHIRWPSGGGVRQRRGHQDRHHKRALGRSRTARAGQTWRPAAVRNPRHLIMRPVAERA